MRSFVFSGLAAVLLLPVTLSAQTASYTFPKAWEQDPSVPVVLFDAVGVPKLGTTFHVKTVPSAGYGQGGQRLVLIVTGFQRLPKPFDTSVLRGPCESWRGKLFLMPAVLTPVVLSPAKTVVTPFPVPNTRGLLGLSFFQQALHGSFTNSCRNDSATLTLSRGGHGVIGT